MSPANTDIIPTRTERARGLMLGLLLGDSIDEWDQQGSLLEAGPVHGGCLTQLACFTLEGVIRAHERAIHRGICSIEGTIWHAWCRWANIQGLEAASDNGWQLVKVDGWTDGWLNQVRPLSVRRGSAPSTVNALCKHLGMPDEEFTADGDSAGHHALTRVLPLAILAPELGESVPRVAEMLARFTHGSPAAWTAAAAGVTIAAEALFGRRQAGSHPPKAFRNDPPGTAGHALWHGWQAAIASESLEGAVRSARRLGHGPAIVAGALYGARIGATSLDENILRRHEIAWVADQLARDAVRDVTEFPAGTEYSQATDPAWSVRYPGW
jgi:hypothetical protein